MNDQLFYDIVLGLEQKSVGDVTAEINALAKQFDEAFKKAGGASVVVDEMGKLVTVTESATKAQNAQISSAVGLQKALEAKRKELSEVNKSIRTGTEVTDADAAAKLRLSTEIRQMSGELTRVQRDTIALGDANNSTTNTYSGLVAANKALMVQMKSVPLDDTTGKLGELQKQYNTNNDRLKAFDATLGNHQRNVGNYKESMQQALMGLRGLPGPLGGAVAGFTAFNAVLRMNPIGAIFTVVQMAVAQLMKLQSVTDAVNVAFAEFNAVGGFALNRIGAFLGLTEKTNFNLREQITNIRELARMEIQLRNMSREAMVTESQLLLISSEKQLQALDQNRSISERIRLMRESIALEEEIADQRFFLADVEFEIAKQRALQANSGAAELEDLARKEARRNDMLREFNESQQRRQQRLQSFERELEAEREAQFQAERRRLDEINKLRRESFKEVQDVFADTSLDLDISDIEKANAFVSTIIQANERRRTELAIQEARSRGDRVQAIELEQTAAFNDFRLNAITAGFTDEARIRELFAGQELEFERQKQNAILDIDRASTGERIKMYENAYTAITTVGSAFFDNNKILQSALATVDAIRAAISAANATVGGPGIKAAAAAVQLARGFALVKRINQTKLGTNNLSASTSSGGTGSLASANIAPPAQVASVQAAANLTGAIPRADSMPTVVINADRDGFTGWVNAGQTDITNRSLVLKNDI